MFLYVPSILTGKSYDPSISENVPKMSSISGGEGSTSTHVGKFIWADSLLISQKSGWHNTVAGRDLVLYPRICQQGERYIEVIQSKIAC